VNTPVPLLYIAGSSHSGSTLLDLLLGSHPAIESVGEAKKIAAVAARVRTGEDPLCTCRATVAACPFWCEVMPEQPEELRRDAAANAALFRRALAARGRRIALDSSKTTGRAALLARSGLFDLTLLHLVRDSRAIAYSNRRKRDKAPSAERKSYGLVSSVRGWQKLNLRARRLFARRPGVRYLAVRYEDLTADPRATLQHVLGALGLPWEESLLCYRGHTHHNIEGNRMRLGGDSAIRADEAFRGALSPVDWALATLLSWRALRAFGYPWKRSPVPPAAGGVTPSLR
jgi:hypothetical protein